MKHVGKTAFARAEQVCASGPDKWAVFDLVVEGADVFGLSHRALSVLRALLSFLPTRHIPTGAQAVVFPANTTLSARLHGMPESTLRRHLAALISSGLVSRRDSPNRKRYARRRGCDIAHAFGFDLAPLVRHLDDISTAAEKARLDQQDLRIKRDEVLRLRAILQNSDEDHYLLLQDVHRYLRRKPDHKTYDTLINQLKCACEKPSEMSGTDSENERHIEPQTKPKIRSESSISLKRVLEICSEITVYFPSPIASWHQFIQTTNVIARMLGIQPHVLDRAKHRLGPENAAIVVGCLLQRSDCLDCPPSYLQRLLSNADPSHRIVHRMLQFASERPVVS